MMRAGSHGFRLARGLQFGTLMAYARLTFLIFLVLQAADGAITYAAVNLFGLSAEANPILTAWICLVGAGPALMIGKSLAIACGLLLYVRGVHRTLALLNLLYIVVALAPWLRLLSAPSL
jgi:hypothetical protein